MPTHWYYDVVQMRNTYGNIQSYLPDNPSQPHPDSWVYFQHIHPEEEQRGSPFRIFHNNVQLFQKPGTHYHHGMQAGESTLHARVQEVLIKSVITSASQEPTLLYNHQDYCRQFFTFMTTPGSHPDTYIGGAMRYFFQQYALDPSSFEGKGYNDPCLLELVAALMWRPAEVSTGLKHEAGRILSNALQRMMDANLEKAKDVEVVCGLPGVEMEETPANTSSVSAADSSSNTLHVAADSASSSNDPAYQKWKASVQAPTGQKYSLEQIVNMSNRDAFDAVFSVRCYAERALPGALYLALKACHDASSMPSSRTVQSIVTEALLSNAQLAGDNAHRGMILGMLLGLIFGDEADCSKLIPSELRMELRKHSNQNADLASLFHKFAETVANLSNKNDSQEQTETIPCTSSVSTHISKKSAAGTEIAASNL